MQYSESILLDYGFFVISAVFSFYYLIVSYLRNIAVL